MTSFLVALNREFRRLSYSTATRRVLRRWGDDHPALGGFGSLQEVLERRSRDSHAAPAILKALAALAPSDELAARTLLHALLPGITRLVRMVGYDDPNALEEMVSLAWERIRTYPPGRQGSVAANVLLDVRKRYRHDLGLTAPTPVDALGEQQPAPATARSAEDEALDMVALGEFVAARRRGVISDAAFGLIVRTRFVGVPLAEIADELNVNTHRLAQRRYLAECRLLGDLRLAG